jgi:hypothetical protein
MKAPSFIATLLLSLGLTWFLTHISYLVAAFFRRKQYAKQRAQRQKQFSEYRSVVSLPEGSNPAEAQGLLDLLLVDHTSSVLAQEKYYSCIFGSVSGLWLAFAVLATGVTVVNRESYLAFVLEVLEIVALASALLFFLLGRKATRLWIIGRVNVEMLRRFVFLRLLYFSGRSGAEVGGLTSAYYSEQDRVNSVTATSSLSDLGFRAKKYWSTQRIAIQHGPCDCITVDAILYYINRRPLRQLIWFRASKNRLQALEKRRTSMLTFLFLVSLLLALIKVVLTHYPIEPIISDGISLLLLLVTGVAAATTSLYMGQNSRSLSHRYAAQETRIDGWIKSLLADHAVNFQSKTSALSEPSKQEMRNAVLEFEDLMNEELVDWIEISHRDVAELTP